MTASAPSFNAYITFILKIVIKTKFRGRKFKLSLWGTKYRNQRLKSFQNTGTTKTKGLELKYFCVNTNKKQPEKLVEI